MDKVQLSTGGHVMVSREAGRVMMTLEWRGYAVTRTLTEDEAALIARALLPTPPPQAACPPLGGVSCLLAHGHSGNHDYGFIAQRVPQAAEPPAGALCVHRRPKADCYMCVNDWIPTLAPPAVPAGEGRCECEVGMRVQSCPGCGGRP
jgi:hypothetical protein